MAEIILGRPCKLGDKGPFDVTLSNIIPVDGSESDAAGLVGQILSQPLGVLEPDLRLMGTERTWNTSETTSPRGSAI